ncbi:MAG: GNAT family N-acetyltransferase [Flavobacteriaceae bacterium]|nr:GNAT family N-acetyltransferase [Flavobacteriaceae bacterium]
MIFETERLIVRKLILDDLLSFHKMQSNPKVMRYVTGDVKSLQEHELELKELMAKYDLPNNNFWIYAIDRKSDGEFIGTCAIVDEVNELGYRFLEQFWGLGYGKEICNGLIQYCKEIGLKLLTAYVVDKNIASAKIIESNNFKVVKKFVSDDLKLPETKYELYI